MAIKCLKIGGNALKSAQHLEAFINVFKKVDLTDEQWVVVHGGGPVIAEVLDRFNVAHEFIGGHRKTDKAAIRPVEMALRGTMNGQLVRAFLRHGYRAVGLSGMDAAMVRSVRRYHFEDGQKYDLGQVGDVERVDTALLHHLLRASCLPVLAPLALADDFTVHNVNADMFAAHIAGALRAEQFILLTDVEGFYRDKNDPSSRLRHIRLKTEKESVWHTLQGGMIPKMEAAETALLQGVGEVWRLNGTRPQALLEWRAGKDTGTRITGE